MGSLVDSVWGKRKEKPPTARWMPSEPPRSVPERAPRGRGFDAGESARQAYRAGKTAYRGGSRVASFAKKTFTGAKSRVSKAFTRKPRVVAVKHKPSYTVEEWRARNTNR